MNKDIKGIKLFNIYNPSYNGGGDFGGWVWDVNGLAPTIKSTAAASQQFVIVEVEDERGNKSN